MCGDHWSHTGFILTPHSCVSPRTVSTPATQVSTPPAPAAAHDKHVTENNICSALLQHVLLCFILIELTQEKKILFSLIIINKADCAAISSVDVYNDLRESQMQWSSQSPLLIQTQPYLARGCHLLTLVQQYKQDVMYGLSVRGGRGGRRGC